MNGAQLPLPHGLVLVREDTGEKYTPCGVDDWTEALAAWRADLDRIRKHPLIARLDARVRARHGSGDGWLLYRLAHRALRVRGLPSPMPEGHCMFADPEAYGLRVFGDAPREEGSVM